MHQGLGIIQGARDLALSKTEVPSWIFYMLMGKTNGKQMGM
jgi:hypothetical protein